ncbi:histidine phosphatase family protein [Gleimia sp. 6138-11-ORH1]|uniref:histidine phosphatase family protein n=1 Tax=Gleimia sp. 6138-11-ORH1 TaxID=2973937 RepID=UPI00216A7E50|nr:histidine phosphatase family protein [Gleimia sp. 6138-11-ORH1]MCS4484258.1 histidine phosphatase family protein [Gleimia sp. 6138-11-ORH1]
MQIVLVRHGQTSSNISRALDTAFPGAPLDETGLAQADALGENFLRLVGAAPEVLYVSPLTRALQTAAAITAQFGIEAIEMPGIREIDAGDLEMSTAEADIYTYLHTLHAWIRGNRDVQMPGGEDGHTVFKRFSESIGSALNAALEAGQETVVFVCHGALCRFIASSLSSQITAELVASFPMNNASTTVLKLLVATEALHPIEPAKWFNFDWEALSWSDQPVSSYPESEMSLDPIPSKLRSAQEPLG